MKKGIVDRLHEHFALSSLSVSETEKDVKKWQSYIANFPETDDCYDLAFYRYCCRMYYFSLPKRLLMNILGFGAFFVELLYILRSNRQLKIPQKGKAVLEKARDIPDYQDIIPEQVFYDYPEVSVIENHNEKFGYLCKEAKKYYWNNFKRHPFCFFFNYFIYMELATHSSILLQENPETVIVYINERNVASPILTAFYQSQGRKLYSFMHGEYILQLVMAFLSFSRYYIWDESYITLFSDDLRCQIKEYIVYTPAKLKRKWDFSETEPSFFCTYYFSGEDEETTNKVISILESLTESGLKCKVRPHPRNRLHITLLNNLLKGSDIVMEYAAETSLKDSLETTEYVVGLQSTVLSEAFAEGKPIVLDDLSNQEHFELLKMQKFNLFNKPHLLFSELVRSANTYC